MVGRVALRVAVLSYLALLVAVPLGLILRHSLEHGAGAAWQSMTTPDALHAFGLTLLIALIAVPVNAAFGILCALLLVRHRFVGRSLLSAFVDLPLGVSPVVVGLAFMLVYGRFGWFGGWFQAHGIQIIFAVPGMVLVTMFVSLPFVVREVVPVLQEIGTEQEEAARTLGSSSWQTFRRITLPSIQSGLSYGIVLSMARAIGEFGAVSVVSGKIIGRTETLTLLVQDRFENFDLTGAYSASVALALIALCTLAAMEWLKPQGEF